MNLKNGAIVLLAYFLLSVAFTWPLAAEFTSKVPGVSDLWTNIWNFWWVEKAVFELKTNPHHTPYLFHPTGVSLAFHTLELGNSFAGALLSNAFSLAVAYNTLVLLSFALAGYGAFMLAKHVTKNAAASLVAGLIYAFSPYHFNEVAAGHLNLLSIQWIPFYALYLTKYAEEGGKKNGILMALSLFAVALTCLQYLGFMGFYTLLYLAFISRSRGWTELKRTFASLFPYFALAALLSAPATYPTLLSTMSGDYVKTGVSSGVYYSADIVSYLSPHPLHPLSGSLGWWVRSRIINNWGYGGINSVGYTVIALLLIYFEKKYGVLTSLKNTLLSDWRKKFVAFAAALAFSVAAAPAFGVDLTHVWAAAVSLAVLASCYFFARKFRPDFWGTSLLVFFLLSLGPFVHVGGYVTLPTPYLLLYLVPGFSIFRVPARFDVLFMLSAAVLCAKTLDLVQQKNRKTAVLVVSCLVLLEFLSLPVPMSGFDIPDFYRQIAGDGGSYAILDAPVAPLRLVRGNVTWVNGLPEYMLHQTTHEKKIVGGYVSYPDGEATSFIETNSFLAKMNDLLGQQNKSLREIAENGRKLILENDIRYVVVHKNILANRFLYEKDVTNETISIIEDTIGRNRTYEDENIIVYDTRQIARLQDTQNAATA